jgi:hypothetical protein
MRKIIIGLAAAGIILTGCSSNEPTPEPKAPETTEVTPAPAPAPETGDSGLTEQEMDDVFINVLSDEEPAFADEPAIGAVIRLAHATCEAFDRGVTFDQAAQVIMDAGFEPYLAGFIIGAGTAAYCPEHEGLVRDAAGV